MNIHAKPGDKVKPIYNDGKLQHGYDHEKEKASKFLEEGKIYTVRKTSVSSWSSLVTLEEIPDKSFNTVHFEDHGEGELPVDGLLDAVERGEKKERLFTLQEMIECWAAAVSFVDATDNGRNGWDKQQYFKEKFNIDLNKYNNG